MTDHQMAQANARLPIIQRALELREQGLSYHNAARQLGAQESTLRNWLISYQTHGFPGLVPKSDQSGRPSVADTLRAVVGERQFQEFVNHVKGFAYDMGSGGLAWRHCARQDWAPQAIREYFAQHRRSKHNIAGSLLDLVKISPVEAMAHRGPRKLSLEGMYTPRRLDILPGDIFSSDDTTPIWAWWIPWPESKEYPFGVKVLQGQFLPVIDVASQHILGYSLIAREASSYRAADIWALFGHIFDKVGLPRLGLQLERGSWDANLIQGVEYEDDEVSHSRRVGGLRMLPGRPLAWHAEHNSTVNPVLLRNLQTFTSYLPKSKSIEGIFHRLQKFEGTIYGCLGRDQMRNPFEKAKKIYEACKRGAADARLHFLSGQELVQRLNDCIKNHEAESIEGRVFSGRPPEVWEKAMREYGPGAELPEEQKFLFRRDWSKVTIRKGMAYVRRADPASGKTVGYFYSNPEIFAEYDNKEVLVYFDRENFQEPAQIVSPSGKYLCSAEYVHYKGMFFGETENGVVFDAYEMKKQNRGAVMTFHSITASYIPSRQLPAEIAARRREACHVNQAEGMASRKARSEASGRGSQVTQVFQDGRGSVTRVERGESARHELVPKDDLIARGTVVFNPSGRVTSRTMETGARGKRPRILTTMELIQSKGG